MLLLFVVLLSVFRFRKFKNSTPIMKESKKACRHCRNYVKRSPSTSCFVTEALTQYRVAIKQRHVM
jgi:hypothetical protein